LRAKFFSLFSAADFSDIETRLYGEGAAPSPEITIEKIIRAIKRINLNKVLKSSEIPNRVLQTKFILSILYFLQLFNACLLLGHYFKQFKKTRTIVLRKPNKNDYTDFKAYRPIALLDTIEKALESTVARRFNDEAKIKQLLLII